MYIHTYIHIYIYIYMCSSAIAKAKPPAARTALNERLPAGHGKSNRRRASTYNIVYCVMS